MTERSRPPDVSDAALALSQPPGAPGTVRTPYGSSETAGAFSGRGVMLGGNPDVWDQVAALTKQGYVDVIGVTPGTHIWATDPAAFRYITWAPPEIEPVTADLHQAENPPEWQVVKDHPNLILNSWEYGDLTDKIILVECYWNEGWSVDFGIFQKYMDAGADAVIPLLGGYATAAHPDANAAVQAQLCEWSKTYGPFPGIWWYAGEDPLTPESVEVLKGWSV